MSDYLHGSKRTVAEIKFLIHDLRVEPFINEVIHFHVTLNTDLELHGVEQAQAIHGNDLASLKDLAVSLRKAFREYSNAVRNFSPEETILRCGRKYVDTIFNICELVLNPLWGRSDQVLVFLPPASRSVLARNHYRNCIAWIRGVRSRILSFRDEEEGTKDLRQQFDVAAEIEAFTRGVIQGYVAESGRAKVELQVGPLEPAVAFGSLPRFHRMYFNLVMNAVDAMSDKRVGVLKVSQVVEGEHIVLRVQDDGEGMTGEKIAHLLRERASLDGELHSLGFVFVLQTVADFGGALAIDSRVGGGTTITIRLPRVTGVVAAPHAPKSSELELLPRLTRLDSAPAPRPSPAPAIVAPVVAKEPPVVAAPEEPAPTRAPEGERAFGTMVLDSYSKSEAQPPGCIFMIAVSEEGRVDAFTQRPYDRTWDIAHEDLAPMLFQTVVRGRLEEDEASTPMLILKPPIDVGEYFDFREVDAAERSRARFTQMVREEYARIAKKLIATGLPATTPVLIADAGRFFGPDDPFTLQSPTRLDAIAARSEGTGAPTAR